jgi:segregation and condensation protein B
MPVVTRAEAEPVQPVVASAESEQPVVEATPEEGVAVESTAETTTNAPAFEAAPENEMEPVLPGFVSETKEPLLEAYPAGFLEAEAPRMREEEPPSDTLGTEPDPAQEELALDDTAAEAVDVAADVSESSDASESEDLSLDADADRVLDVPGEKEAEAAKKGAPELPPVNWHSATEAILLAADKPVSVQRLKEVFGEEGPSAEEIEKILERVAERHSGVESGITLRKSWGGWQFTTRGENARFVQRFLATKPFRLGKAALETLSIVAYRQPVTRAEIDQVRGIDSSHLLRVLMDRGLVRMAGKADLPGRPVQYATTPKFLETVGLPSLADLPPLSELEQLKGDTPDPIKELEAGLERFVQEAPTPFEVSRQATDGLPEIDALIEKAEDAPKEVYASPEAADVAKANEEALLAHQESAKKVRSARRKKTITFDELTGASPAAHGTAAPAPAIEGDGTAAEALADAMPPPEEPPPDLTA